MVHFLVIVRLTFIGYSYLEYLIRFARFLGSNSSAMSQNFFTEVWNEGSRMPCLYEVTIQELTNSTGLHLQENESRPSLYNLHESSLTTDHRTQCEVWLCDASWSLSTEQKTAVSLCDWTRSVPVLERPAVKRHVRLERNFIRRATNSSPKANPAVSAWPRGSQGGWGG